MDICKRGFRLEPDAQHGRLHCIRLLLAALTTIPAHKREGFLAGVRHQAKTSWNSASSEPASGHAPAKRPLGADITEGRCISEQNARRLALHLYFRCWSLVMLESYMGGYQ
jgi:hypothetical protein